MPPGVMSISRAINLTTEAEVPGVCEMSIVSQLFIVRLKHGTKICILFNAVATPHTSKKNIMAPSTNSAIYSGLHSVSRSTTRGCVSQLGSLIPYEHRRQKHTHNGRAHLDVQ